MPVSRKKLSLIQRLSVLIGLIVLLSIGGALIANLLHARSYLEQQLNAQSVDTAHGLALMLTQYHADPVMAQTLLNSSFDQGHFSLIRWEGVDRKALVNLASPQPESDVPGWFRGLLPLEPSPGTAQVSNGWMQAGRIIVQSQPNYAYLSLWRGALHTVYWLCAIGIVAALIGALDIRQMKRQLASVVRQAQAISERRFHKIPIPGIPDLAEVALAMNHMVDRLQRYLDGLRDELDLMRQKVLTDNSTGLPNREAFELRLGALLKEEEDPVRGFLFLVRVANLMELNQRLGGSKTDALLKRLADDLSQRCQPHPGWMATRLRGADFAMLCPEIDSREASKLADELCACWGRYQSMDLIDRPGVANLAIVPFHSGDGRHQLLTQANQTLSLAEAKGGNAWEMDSRVGAAPDGLADFNWQSLFDNIHDDHALRLRWYPVCLADGSVAWQEGMLYRVQTEHLPQMSAMRLVAHALRLGRSAALDLKTLALALREGPDGRLAINVSPASLSAADFLPQAQQLLGKHPKRRIHFEFDEAGLEDNWQAFVAFARGVRVAGHRVAVEIQGHNMELVARLHEAGIDYLVLDHSLTHNIHQDQGREALLRGMLRMASLMVVELEAKGVASPQDKASLIEIGVQLLTGPAVK
jgi:EAL domain-containing protein (putative c-di-GMP-specific phosphodiesterase class I)/GGDEF domain-containing protein